ncbi:MAG TPA: hypothetical protein P5217_07060 [Methanoregulaceae archaeon]|nr:hypothetical protein [Methanoregulaceae archaeon]HPD75660.1 hypothetical protein [Methanoregulaceae archaeon]HRY76025.1 hypothetical protein [Methanoregulaceae archaeon]
MKRPESRTIILHRRFSRHDRDYCLFSIEGKPYEFLYFSHREKDLRSLFYGSGFLDMIPRIEQEKPDLCIECGLGTRIRGGVSLDDGDVVAWHCSGKKANGIIVALRENLGPDGNWIKPF